MCKVTAWEVREINNVTPQRLRCVAVPRIHDERDHAGGMIEKMPIFVPMFWGWFWGLPARPRGLQVFPTPPKRMWVVGSTVAQRGLAAFSSVQQRSAMFSSI